jgi:DNA sulfur modification protein DndB
MELKSFSYLEVTQINRKLILTKLPAGILVNIFNPITEPTKRIEI